MSKKSASALTTVTPLTNRRPSAPAELPESSAALWRSICQSLPSGYFTPGDLPLLTAYCLAHHHKAAADVLVGSNGLVIDGKANPAIALSMQLSASMSTLAGKLRLCQSSRTRPESAALKKVLRGGQRPWERDSAEDEFFNDGL